MNDKHLIVFLGRSLRAEWKLNCKNLTIEFELFNSNEFESRMHGSRLSDTKNLTLTCFLKLKGSMTLRVPWQLSDNSCGSCSYFVFIF